LFSNDNFIFDRQNHDEKDKLNLSQEDGKQKTVCLGDISNSLQIEDEMYTMRSAKEEKKQNNLTLYASEGRANAGRDFIPARKNQTVVESDERFNLTLANKQTSSAERLRSMHKSIEEEILNSDNE